MPPYDATIQPLVAGDDEVPQAELHRLQLRIAQLESENHRLREVTRAGSVRLDRLPVLVATTAGPDHRVTWMNALAGRVLGHRGPVGSQPLLTLWPGDRPEGLRAHLEAAYRQGESPVGETSVPSWIPEEAGRRRYLEYRLEPLGRGPRAAGVQLVATDVTRAVRARREAETLAFHLRSHEDRFASALQTAGVGTWHWSAPDDLIHWDEGLREILGVPREAMPRDAAALLARVHPEDRRDVVEAVRRALRRAEHLQVRCRVLHPDGALRWVEGSGRGHWDPDGSLLYLAGAVVDVTSRVAAEEAAGRREAALSFLADHMPQVVFTVDSTGRLLSLNGRFEHLTGHPTRAALGSGWAPWLHPEDRSAWLRGWDEALLAGRRFEGEARVRARQGGWRWHLFRTEPWTQASPAPSRWLGTATDVHDQKLAQAEREQLLDELREAVSARDTFLSVAAHELRTPLTTLGLMAGGLARGLATDSLGDASGRAGRLERQVRRLDALVTQLLDVSRITSGRLTVSPVPLDLAQVVTEVVEAHRDELDRSGCRLTLEAPHPVPGRWDVLRVEQVVTNLVQNAIKYGRGAPIRVACGLRGEEARVVVADRGIGIDPADQARIFERFERAVTVDHYGGLGLGLWLTRQLVEAMGGEVGVHSRLGEGATFVVRLPREP